MHYTVVTQKCTHQTCSLYSTLLLIHKPRLLWRVANGMMIPLFTGHSHCWYLQQVIKYWWWEWPGNEVRMTMVHECKSQTWMLFHTKLQFGFVQNDLFDMQMPYEYQHVAVISVMWEIYTIGSTMGGRRLLVSVLDGLLPRLGDCRCSALLPLR